LEAALDQAKKVSFLTPVYLFFYTIDKTRRTTCARRCCIQKAKRHGILDLDRFAPKSVEWVSR
jgi:hypothetical protein